VVAGTLVIANNVGCLTDIYIILISGLLIRVGFAFNRIQPRCPFCHK
jgi:hypothetical protein